MPNWKMLFLSMPCRAAAFPADRCSVGGVGAAMAPALSSTPAHPATVAHFELDELTIADLQAGIASGKFTSRSLTEKYTAADRRD